MRERERKWHHPCLYIEFGNGKKCKWCVKQNPKTWKTQNYLSQTQDSIKTLNWFFNNKNTLFFFCCCCYRKNKNHKKINWFSFKVYSTWNIMIIIDRGAILVFFGFFQIFPKRCLVFSLIDSDSTHHHHHHQYIPWILMRCLKSEKEKNENF